MQSTGRSSVTVWEHVGESQKFGDVGDLEPRSRAIIMAVWAILADVCALLSGLLV